MFRKVLVANRGEIAVRIIRALRELGIPSVAVYSDADRASLHVQLSDEAANIGPAPSGESYLNMERVLEAAKQHQAEAIHPGYGFLSENANFAQACQNAGLTFVGPPVEAIRKMGSKTEARKLAVEANVPVVPGTAQSVADFQEAREVAAGIGYPVLLKAAAGGGGKGMRSVASESELAAALRDAASEAGNAFGNSDVYLEKLLVEPRHIEFQVLGDAHGNLIHLGERECSIQRRHQKVIEESPSPLLEQAPELRRQMGEAAVRVAKHGGYTNAGTIEFLVDRNRDFYFLEMNTRLQVEHPVTEMVTGLDLVHWQLRIAAGQRLTITQADVVHRGAAIECRAYAEDPANGFFPSPGRISRLVEPAGPGIRLDSGIYPGWTIPIDYDPLLAKLAAWGETREIAIQRMLSALSEFTISGIRTNLGLFADILRDPQFRAGELHTSYLQDFMQRRPEPVHDEQEDLAAAVALALAAEKPAAPPSAAASNWLAAGRARLLRG